MSAIVLTGFRVRLPVTAHPCIASASLYGVGLVRRIMNCQVQGHHTVATAGIGERVGEGIRAGGNVRMLVPVEAVARKRRRVARVAVAHRQMQRHHAVTTAGVRKRMGQ